MNSKHKNVLSKFCFESSESEILVSFVTHRTYILAYLYPIGSDQEWIMDIGHYKLQYPAPAPHRARIDIF